MSGGEPGDAWDGVVGQAEAVAHLRRAAVEPVHAYLFVGPAGSTKHEAARAFAAAVLTANADPDGRDARLALAGAHPDVHEVERVGPAISKEQAVEIVHLTSLAPVEGDRKVLILHDFHLLSGDAAARLLKSIEEPPPSTTFVVLADFVPPELITISSRCVRVEFHTIPTDVLAARLETEGVDARTAVTVATAAAGNLARARVLAGDPALEERRRAFAELPQRLDGTGATVVAAVDDLLGRIDAAASPLAERQTAEADRLEAERPGDRGARKALEERHKRELRRHRVDELRSGLGVLAGSYRDLLVAGRAHRPESLADAVTRIHRAVEALERNPNESLLLQSLLWSLPAGGGV